MTHRFPDAVCNFPKCDCVSMCDQACAAGAMPMRHEQRRIAPVVWYALAAVALVGLAVIGVWWAR